MINGRLILLYAPPGYGKTTGIFDLFEKGELSFVFLSPLRAIAEEVFERASGLGLKVQWRAQKRPEEKTFIVSTFESLHLELFDGHEFLFIIDEFHLLYYWGESFRPLLLERYYDLCAKGAHILALTATLEENLFSKVRKEALEAFDEFRLIDLEGGRLLFKPRFYLSFTLFSQQEQLAVVSFYQRWLKGRVLIFCPYRADVERVAGYFKERGLRVASCVGGEVEQFVKQSKKAPEPEIIVATSVLGHGVNLGAIRLVCFLSPVDNGDFYVQMLARGGRDGKGFIVMHRQGQSFLQILLQLLLWPFIKLLAHATL